MLFLERDVRQILIANMEATAESEGRTLGDVAQDRLSHTRDPYVKGAAQITLIRELIRQDRLGDKNTSK